MRTLAPRSERPRLLITGASGFIGRRLAWMYHAQGADLHLVVRPSSAGEGLPPGATRLRLDLRDDDAVRAAIAGLSFDTAYLLAAATFGRRGPVCAEQLAQLEATNVQAPQLLLRALDGRAQRVVRLGTLLEYGPHLASLTERTTPAPDSAYARSMLEGTNFTRALCASQGVELVTLRPSLVYGPGMGERSVLGWARARFAANQMVQLEQPGARRDPLYIDDLLRAMKLASELREVDDDAFNLGAGTGHKVGDLVAALAEAMRVPWTQSEDNVECDDRVVADSSHAASRLGWIPATALEQGLRAYVADPFFRGPHA